MSVIKKINLAGVIDAANDKSFGVLINELFQLIKLVDTNNLISNINELTVKESKVFDGKFNTDYINIDSMLCYTILYICNRYQFDWMNAVFTIYNDNTFKILVNYD